VFKGQGVQVKGSLSMSYPWPIKMDVVPHPVLSQYELRAHALHDAIFLHCCGDKRGILVPKGTDKPLPRPHIMPTSIHLDKANSYFSRGGEIDIQLLGHRAQTSVCVTAFRIVGRDVGFNLIG
jgi:hypothetical protein